MNINDLSNTQLNYLAALAHYGKDHPYCLWGTTEYHDGKGNVRIEKNILNYDPINNVSQAFELALTFKMEVDFGAKKAGCWITPYKWVEQFAETVNKAIVLAVVASKYGEDIDETLLD